MAGLGYIVGGALQGLGSGLAKQGEMDAAARREAALEALRARNRRDEMVADADLRDRNDARSTQRDTSKQIVVGKANTQNTIVVDDARTKNDIKLKAIDLGNSTALARLNSALDIKRDAASQQLRQQLEAGEITQTFEADDGQIWGLNRGGQRVATGVYFAPKTMKDGEEAGGTIGAARAAAGAATPPAAPSPRTKPVGGGQPPAQSAPGKPVKTYSASEVKSVAKELGWTEQQVREWAKARGWKLTN